MKGWDIFVHSVRLVFRNLDAALRISLVLYLVYAIGQFWLMSLAPAEVAGTPGALALTPQQAVGSLLSMLVTVLVSIWIAVAWHRYVLLEEVPHGWLPRFHGGILLGYLGRSILLGILVVLATLVVGMVIGMIGTVTGSSGLIMLGGILGVAAGIFLFYRLCPILPAGATGQPISMSRAWQATQGIGGTVLLLVVLTLLATFLLGIPNTLSGDPNSALSRIYSLVVGWPLMLVGISVLTTFYGHFIEGRPID